MADLCDIVLAQWKAIVILVYHLGCSLIELIEFVRELWLEI